MQGFNMGRYIPPSTLDTSLTSTPGAAADGGKGSRARNPGGQTVRFEMPFAVWCATCPQPAIIAQGVRFNAEKRRVGSYHSTPVWAFRMRHAACGGALEIRTDPRNAEYVVHEGAKRRDYGEGKGEGAREDGAFGEIVTEEERERRRNDAFAAFEGKVQDKEKGRLEGQRVAELLQDRGRHWDDVYAANQRLRKTFRAERKVRHRNEQEKQAIQDRLGLHIELLDETAADRKAASLVEFGAEPAQDTLQVVSGRPLFAQSTRKSTRKTLSHSTQLQESLKGNTRAALDPFAVQTMSGTGRAITKKVPTMQAKTSTNEPTGKLARNEEPGGPITTDKLSQALAAYDSD